MTTFSFMRGALLLSVALIGAGCASSPPESENRVPDAALSADAPSRARPETQERIMNPNARFGYVRVVREQEVTMDTAEWLTGDAARAQAVEDGECVRGLPCLPLGFYLRNRSVELETLRVGPQARVILLDGPGATRELSWVEFQALYASWPELQQRVTPFHVDLQNGQVIGLREQSLEGSF